MRYLVIQSPAQTFLCIDLSQKWTNSGLNVHQHYHLILVRERDREREREREELNVLSFCCLKHVVANRKALAASR